MAVVDFIEPQPLPLGIQSWLVENGAGWDQTTGLQTNAVGEKAYTVLKVPKGKGGTVKGMVWGAYETGAGDIELRVETVDSSGNPSGTLVLANSKKTFAATTGGYKWNSADFDGTFAISDGDVIAVGWEVPTGSGVDCRTTRGTAPTTRYGFGRQSRHHTTSWLRSIQHDQFGLVYDDDTVWLFDGMPPVSGAATNPAFDANNNPNTRGNQFTVDFEAPFYGFKYVHPHQLSADFDLELYGPSGLLAEATVDSSLRSQAWYTDCVPHTGSPVTLSPGTTYVIAFEATHASSTINPGLSNFASAATRAGSILKNFAYATAHDPGDASDFAVDTTKFLPIYPVVGGLEIPAGGGGGAAAAAGIFGS